MTLYRFRDGSEGYVALPTTPGELTDAIMRLDAPSRLRMAANLLEAKHADMAHVILEHDANSLGQALAEARYGVAWPLYWDR